MTSFAVLTYAFLYLPIVVLVVFSFNDANELLFPIRNLSLRWYHVLFNDYDIHTSILNSLIVCAVVVPMSLLLGTLAAFALDRFRFPAMGLFERLLLLPLIVPRLVTGLAILLLIKMLGMRLSLVSIIIGHIVAWLPLVVSQVHARLRRFDRRLEEASMDLGGNRWNTFWRVTFPNIRTALIGSGLLVFTLSFDEIAISFFLTGAENTLPMHIWSMLREGITPEIAAIAAINVLISFLMVIFSIRLLNSQD